MDPVLGLLDDALSLGLPYYELVTIVTKFKFKSEFDFGTKWKK
jgi:hypothetical protein